MSPEVRETTKKINEDWLKEKDREAADPTYVASINGNVADADSLQYLDEIIKGILNMYFICRHRSCLFFSRNTTWIPNALETEFLCPCCGARYRPRRSTTELIDAQFIMVFTVGKETQYMLAEWPESAEMGWVNKQMETCAGLTVEDRSLSQEQLKVKLREIAKSKALPFEWDVFHVSLAARVAITELDKQQPKEGWNLKVMNDLATAGYQGAQIQYQDPMPVLLQDDFLRLVNLCGLCHRRNLASMRR